MKKTLLVLLISMTIGQISFAQSVLNMNLLSNVDYTEGCNDIWGYVDPDDGAEYAILGTVLATAILDLVDPTDPQELAYIPGANSTWRDMKQWGEYVYVTTDVGNDGLLIIDMTMAPDSISWTFWKPELEINGDVETLRTCHNIYIDNGRAYLSGCNISNEAVIILDIATDPKNPIYLGATDNRYSHDNFVKGNILYSADIQSGIFSIADITDPANPVELATQSTSFNFTHNIWPSTDGKYVFTTDERANAFVDAYDISDLNNIKFLDAFRPKDTEGTGVIPHNTHYHPDGYLVTSWYTDGVVIVDANRPENLVQVANYDTNTDFFNDFHGCWGAYPFLPSGIMLASDRENGLFVLGANLVRASYLEGKITNSVTNTPINGAEVEILNPIINGANSNAIGDYKTGLAEPGTYRVAYSRTGYFSDTVEVSINSGEVTIQDVQLEPIATFSGRVIAASNGAAIPQAKVAIINETLNFLVEVETDDNGDFQVPSFIPDLTYTLVGGKWGFLHMEMTRNIEPSASITLVLSDGYQDDFILDQGWTEESVATTGNWERAEPIGTFTNGGSTPVNPEFDIDGDIGDLCYMTGNGGGGAGGDDVDGGETVLTSPPMALSSYNNPTVSYYTWFFSTSPGANPTDSFAISITNGVDTAKLETIFESNSDWRPQSVFNLSDFITITDDMRMIYTANDADPGSLVEAAVDVFLVTEGMSTSNNEVFGINHQLNVFPNPFNSSINVQYEIDQDPTATIQVMNVLGQGVEMIELDQIEGTLNIGQNWENGIYFIQLITQDQQSKMVKVIKQ